MFFIFLSICSSAEIFKKCNDMRFCYHNIDRIGEWAINNPKFDSNTNEFSADLFNNGHDDDLKFIVYLMQNNSFRIRFLPTNQENFARYKTYENSLIINQTIINQHLPLDYKSESNKFILKSNDCQAEIFQSPFYITITDKFNSKILINQNQTLVFEHIGEKVPPDYWPYYMNDTIKNGATATGIDFSFPDAKTRLTGLSESDDSINLEDTGDEPRRSANFDIYSNYGHIPLVYGHSPKEMISFFWLNPTDTFFKIKSDRLKNTRDVRVLSEGGYADIIIFTGKIFDILASYTELTGRIEMPPLFALGYHQSKWGYRTQKTVEAVIDEFDNHEFPLDVFWLDVDHLHGYEPFRFNRSAFPNPDSLFQKLSGHNRYLVRINDPHMPEDDTHKQYKYAIDHGFFVNKSDGLTPFNGLCWPGSSFWPDFLNPDVWKWWSSLYKYEANETAPNVFFWNDMNEPSVFTTVEGTFPKENVYFGGYEQREIRNLYGVLMVSATHDGVIARNDDKNQRPFILTRSYFAGSQRYSWFWSGDNTANYSHLRRSVPMALVAGLCGMPMTGADMGGFNLNTSEQLVTRWYQAGSFCYPLFRSHTHLNSSFREPFTFDDFTFSLLKKATIGRYEGAPLWYTAVHFTHKTGVPPVLPLFALFPEIEELHDIDDQFVLGQSLMVAPILDEDAKTRKIVKPPGIWYNFTNGQKLTDWSTVTIDVYNHSLPLFVRGGSILPFFTSVGRSMEETSSSPIKLVVGCDEDGNAEGPLYLDDGKTFNYEHGEFLNRMIVFIDGKIKIKQREPAESILHPSASQTYIKEISFFGLKKRPQVVSKDAVLSCNDKGDQCTMKGFKLFLKDITPDDDGGDGDDDDKDDGKVSKKFMYIVVGCCAGAAGVLLIIVVVLSVILFLKNKQNSNIGIDDKKNTDSILIESQDNLQN